MLFRSQVINALLAYVADTREESVDLARTAGWKDVIDVLRYMATTTLPVIRADHTVPVVGRARSY